MPKEGNTVSFSLPVLEQAGYWYRVLYQSQLTDTAPVRNLHLVYLYHCHCSVPLLEDVTASQLQLQSEDFELSHGPLQLRLPRLETMMQHNGIMMAPGMITYGQPSGLVTFGASHRKKTRFLRECTCSTNISERTKLLVVD